METIKAIKTMYLSRSEIHIWKCYLLSLHYTIIEVIDKGNNEFQIKYY